MIGMFHSCGSYGVLLVLCTVLSLSSALKSYDHDGKTTYCWHTGQSVFSTALLADQIKNTAQSLDCPLSMNLNLWKTTVAPGETFPISWTITQNLREGKNLFGLKEVFFVRDPASQKNVSVIHSNIHACKFGSSCDPFDEGEGGIDNTKNEVANFTGTVANFEAKEYKSPTEAGVYTILAHIVLGAENPVESRYDFAVYQKLTVSPSTSTEDPSGGKDPVEDSNSNAKSDSDSDSNTGLIIGCSIAGVVVVILVAVGLIWYRRRQTVPRLNHDDYINPLNGLAAANYGQGKTHMAPSLHSQSQGSTQSMSINEYMQETRGYTVQPSTSTPIDQPSPRGTNTSYALSKADSYGTAYRGAQSPGQYVNNHRSPEYSYARGKSYGGSDRQSSLASDRSFERGHSSGSGEINRFPQGATALNSQNQFSYNNQQNNIYESGSVYGDDSSCYESSSSCYEFDSSRSRPGQAIYTKHDKEYEI